MYTSNLTKYLTSIAIFRCHLVRLCKMEIHTTGRPSNLIYTGYKQEGLSRDLELTHINFALLNSHVTVIYLRFIKTTNCYVVKQKSKMAVFFLVIYP